MLEVPATVVRIRDRLLEGGFHVLHLVGHGGIDAEGCAHLVLETTTGEVELVPERMVAEIVEGDLSLRLITLMACHGGASAGDSPFSGLAPQLVRRGVPAAIAASGALPVDAAGCFTEHLYRHLALWGRVDAAVNEARQKLHLTASDLPDWSLPMLFMRLEDGVLWQGSETLGGRSPAEWIRELTSARGRGSAIELQGIETQMGPLEDVDGDLAMELFLAYRAVESWDDMVRIYDRLPRGQRQLPAARQQLAFALNRQGEHQQAIWMLDQLLQEVGPSHETCGMMGRAYKDLWRQAEQQDRTILATGYLDKAIANYIQGFEIDWRNGYAGINALTLLDIKGAAESLERQRELLPLVQFAVKQQLRAERPGYWAHATALELAVLGGDGPAASSACAEALVTMAEPWQGVSTADNLRLIRDRRRARGVVEPWLDQLIAELSSLGNPPR